MRGTNRTNNSWIKIKCRTEELQQLGAFHKPENTRFSTFMCSFPNGKFPYINVDLHMYGRFK